MSRRGKLVLVVAPSGSGKDTLIDAAELAYPDLATLVTCTTRAPRPGEIDDVDYHFLSKEEFDHKIAEGEFLEWAEYGGNRYGTLRASIESVLVRGEVLLATIEVQGARRAREILPSEELAIVYVEAGGWDVLSRRIQMRAPISEGELAKRHERYLDEATFKEEAHFIVSNLDGALDDAKNSFVEVIGTIRHEVATRE